MPVINSAEDADKLGVKVCANCGKREKKEQGLCEDMCANYDNWIPRWSGFCGTVDVGKGNDK